MRRKLRAISRGIFKFSNCGEGQASGCRVLVDSDGDASGHSAICVLCNLSLLDFATCRSLFGRRLLMLGSRRLIR